MSQLGPVGVGLSVAFGLFMVVLLVELYYVWLSRERRLQGTAQANGRNTGLPSAILVKKRRPGGISTTEPVEAVKDCAKWHLQPAAKCRFMQVEVVTQPQTAELSARALIKEPTEEEEEEEDILKVGGLWPPPRLLFTIIEEEEEEEEEEQQEESGGERLFFPPSASTSPFVTPPLSPPFATPFGSPHPPSLPINRPFTEMDSASSPSSSQHSDHRSCSALFNETSSPCSSVTSSSEASSSAPPALFSHLAAGPPLGLLSESPPSPLSALYNYHNRVLALDYSSPKCKCIPVLSSPTLHLKPAELPMVSSPSFLPTPSTFPISTCITCRSTGVLTVDTRLTGRCRPLGWADSSIHHGHL